MEKLPEGLGPFIAMHDDGSVKVVVSNLYYPETGDVQGESADLAIKRKGHDFGTYDKVSYLTVTPVQTLETRIQETVDEMTAKFFAWREEGVKLNEILSKFHGGEQ